MQTPSSEPPSASSSDRRALAKRLPPTLLIWLRRVALVLVALELLYLVVVNLVLATHVIDKNINAATDDVEMHLPRAWSFWPGRVHVRDFSFRISDSNVQAILRVEEAYAKVDLLPLLRKKVVLRDATAHGARYWMRHRVSAITEANRAQVEAFPPIPGVEPPLFDPARMNQPPPDLDSLWTIEVHDGNADGDELWVQEFHYTGAFRGAGSFVFAPLQSFELLPTTGHLEPGTVDLGEHRLSNDFRLDMQLALARFVVPETTGLEPFRGLDAKLELGTTIADGKWLGLYKGLGLPAIELHDLAVEGTVAFRDKHFTEETDLRVKAARVGVVTRSVRGGGSFAAAVMGRPKGHLAVRLDAPDSTMAPRDVPSLVSHPFHLLRTALELDAFAELDAEPSVALHSLKTTASMPSLSWLEPFTQGAWKGSGKAQVDLAIKPGAKGALTGTLAATIDETKLQAKNLITTFSGKSRASFSADRGLSTLHLANFESTFPVLSLQAGNLKRTSSAVVKMPKATFSTDSKKLLGEVTISVPLSALLTVPIEAEGGLAKLAAKWLNDGPTSAHAHFSLTPKGPALSLDRATVGKAKVKGFLTTRTGFVVGAFLVDALGVSTGVRLDAKGPALVPFAGDGWMEAQLRGK